MNEQHKNFATDNAYESTSLSTIDDIIDDIWIDIFCMLSIKDFVSINQTCCHFRTLSSTTNVHSDSKKKSKKKINQYWQHRCSFQLLKTLKRTIQCSLGSRFTATMRSFWKTKRAAHYVSPLERLDTKKTLLTCFK